MSSGTHQFFKSTRNLRPLKRIARLTVYRSGERYGTGRPRVNVTQIERQRLHSVGSELVLVVEHIVVSRERRAPQRIYNKDEEIALVKGLSDAKVKRSTYPG